MLGLGITGISLRAELIHHKIACSVSVDRLCRNCILVHLPYRERMVRGMKKSRLWLGAFMNFHLRSFKLRRVLLLKVKFSVFLLKLEVQVVWVFSVTRAAAVF